jgi:hypothetical protein
MSTEIDYNNPAFALQLLVNLINTGGVDGLSPTVAIRLLPSTNLYLDWTTLTFKVAGWGVKFEPMVDVGNGIYQAILNVAGLGFTPLSGLPQNLSAEYNLPASPLGGEGQDFLVISELRPDAKIARQYDTNRLEAEGGSPDGTLTIYEDDGVTVQAVQQLNDYAGGPVVNTIGTPAKRGPVP